MELSERWTEQILALQRDRSIQLGQDSGPASTSNHAPSNFEACILHDCRCTMTDQRPSTLSLPTTVGVITTQMLYLLKSDGNSERPFSRLWCQSTNRHVWRDDDCLTHVTTASPRNCDRSGFRRSTMRRISNRSCLAQAMQYTGQSSNPYSCRIFTRHWR